MQCFFRRPHSRIQIDLGTCKAHAPTQLRIQYNDFYICVCLYIYIYTTRDRFQRSKKRG